MPSVAACVVLLLFCCCALAPEASTQETNCPYFQYLSLGSEYIGKITLPISQAVTDLNVKFSQRNPIVSNYYGSLTLYDDEETTKLNIRNGQPVSYRVNFPTPGVLPRLVLLQLNGAVICSGSDYPPPSTMINLTHTLRSTTLVYPLNNASPGGVFNYVNVQQPQRQQPTIVQTIQPVRNEIVPQNFGIQSSFVQPSQEQRPTFSRRPQPQPQPQQQQQPQPQPPQQIQPQRRPQAPQPQSQPSRGQVNFSCGREGNSITPFIHYGHTLARGQIPWLTAIYQKQTGVGLKFICGGSLVSRRTVITAAHCFKLTGLSANRVLIYLGRHNLDDYSENGIQAREVAELINHPQYNTNTFPDADIALVQLQQSVEYTTWIQPICLWSESFELNLPPRKRGYVAGWGGDENNSVITNLPKMVDAEIVSEADCLRSLEVQDFSSNRTLCAGNLDGSGPCMGDSGGGLMLNYNGVWLLRGVVSAGQVTDQSHCNLRQYVIYCDVAKHISWVRQNVRD